MPILTFSNLAVLFTLSTNCLLSAFMVECIPGKFNIMEIARNAIGFNADRKCEVLDTLQKIGFYIIDKIIAFGL